MPVPSVMTDLSISATSNSPAGTDPIGTSLDDYLRTIQAIVRREQAQGASIASAGTTSIGANTDGNYLHITGTTTITSFGTVAAGIRRTLVFDGALTLTYNATSMILPGAASIATVANDVAEFASEGSGNWRCLRYLSANGTTTTDITMSGASIKFSDGSAQASAQVGMKNRIINGGFTLNQRGYVSGTALAADAYGHDRFKGGAAGGTYTFTQGALGVNTTINITAGTMVQIIEGCNVAEGGTYVLSWTGTAQGRLNGGAYGASGTVTVTGWVAGTNLPVEFNTGTVGSIQLEKGSIASSFDYRDYGGELIMCQRYFFKTFAQGTAPAQGVGSTAGALLASTSATSTFGASLVFPVTMRATPSVVTYNPSAANANWRDTNNGADRALSGTTFADSGISVSGSAGIVNGLNFIHAAASAEL